MEVYPLTDHQWIISSGWVLLTHNDIDACQGLKIIVTNSVANSLAKGTKHLELGKLKRSGELISQTPP